MKKSNEIIWWLDFPKDYFERITFEGIVLMHSAQIESDPECVSFNGNWDHYSSDIETRIICHDEIKLINTLGNCKTIILPKKFYVTNCFIDSANDDYFPTIFEAKNRIVYYHTYPHNLDGVLAATLVTIDIDGGTILKQEFKEEWALKIQKKILTIGDEVYNWSRNELKLFLNDNETKLAMHSVCGQSDEYSITLILSWLENSWDLIDVLVDFCPKDEEFFEFNNEFFQIGHNSLIREYCGR